MDFGTKRRLPAGQSSTSKSYINGPTPSPGPIKQPAVKHRSSPYFRSQTTTNQSPMLIKNLSSKTNCLSTSLSPSTIPSTQHHQQYQQHQQQQHQQQHQQPDGSRVLQQSSQPKPSVMKRPVASCPETPELPTSLPYADFTVLNKRQVASLQCMLSVRAIVAPSNSQNDRHSSVSSVRLNGFWSQTLIDVGDKIRVFHPDVNVPGTESADICDDRNFLLVHPDVLVQCTSIAGSLYCQRKVILNEKFRGGCQPGNKVMILGTVVHCLFQDRSILLSLYGLEWTVADFTKQCEAYFPVIQQWCTRHLGSVRQPLLSTTEEGPLAGARVTAIRDIEENVWCSKFGVRGKIDLSLNVEGCSQELLPAELKTGKSSHGADHRGQVLLYTLMLSSLEGSDEPGAVDGQLIYLKDGAQHTVHRTFNGIRGLMQLRNQVAHYLSNPLQGDGKLPETLDDQHVCSNCEQAVVCSAWSRSIEPANPSVKPSAWMQSFQSSMVQHLSDDHLMYFAASVRKELEIWQRALVENPRNADAWLVDGDQRELDGHCLNGLKVKRVYQTKRERLVAQHFIMVFKRDDNRVFAPVFKVGEMVLVSNVSRQHYVMFMGPVVEVSETEIGVRLDRKPMRKEVRADTYRLDRYQSNSTFQLKLANQARLLEGSEQAARLRRLLIDLEKPCFAERLPETVVERILLDKMVADHVDVLLRVLMTMDYAVVMDRRSESDLIPLIMTLLAALLRLDQSVLLCTFSNAKLEALIDALKRHPSLSRQSDKILHLGSSSGQSPFHLEHSLAKNSESVESMEKCMTERLSQASCVVCSSFTASNHVMFDKRRDFDYVLVLDAIGCGNSMLIGPLLTGQRWILLDSQSNFDRSDSEKSHVVRMVKKHPDCVISLQ